MSERYPAGITVDILGRSQPISAGQVTLLLRATYAPGAQIPPHTDPGTGVWVVERGTIGFAVEEGEAVITRAGSTATEHLAAGQEIALNPGDTASYDPDNVHTSRNPSDKPASMLIAGVYAEHQALIQPARS